MAKKQKVTAENYNKIRKLAISKAFTTEEVCEMFNISPATLSTIRSNETYEGYRAYVTRAWKEAWARKQAKTQGQKTAEAISEMAKAEVTVPAMPNFYEVQLEQIIELLTKIDDKLGKLPVMQELYKEEEEEEEPKRGFFGFKNRPF